MSENYDVTIKHPSRILVFGPSGSGKTSLIVKILMNCENVFGLTFDFIAYVSGLGFPNIDDVSGVKINKLREIDSLLIDDLDTRKNNLLIFDDNIYVTNDRLMSDLFTKLSHHKNITVILLIQNLFPRTKYSRDISINSTYIILMANNRDRTQILRLSQQMDGTKFIYNCYKDNTKDRPYSYLLLDFHPDTPENYRVRSSLFQNEPIYTYVKKSEK